MKRSLLFLSVKNHYLLIGIEYTKRTWCEVKSLAESSMF